MVASPADDRKGARSCDRVPRHLATAIRKSHFKTAVAIRPTQLSLALEWTDEGKADDISVPPSGPRRGAVISMPHLSH